VDWLLDWVPNSNTNAVGFLPDYYCTRSDKPVIINVELFLSFQHDAVFHDSHSSKPIVIIPELFILFRLDRIIHRVANNLANYDI
jgi:hypothetical protein